jgi:glycosyltransferase XagB
MRVGTRHVPRGTRTSLFSCTATAAACGLAAAHLVPLAFRLGVAAVGAPRHGAPVDLAASLPVYTVLGPMHREPGRVRPWLDAVRALDYPRRALDVCLLIEADDVATLTAARAEQERLGRPAWLRVLVVPPGGPRTKPNALNHGLAVARGELLVVYDAEDSPAPGQLREAAAAFAALPSRVACLQARLVVAPRPGDRLGGVMAVDYALWHGRFIPGLARLGAPVPLGGTSNHLRVSALRALGGWRPDNLAEDAELGLRLARGGLRTEMISSVTIEDGSPPGLRAWIRQRSRWSQGFAQTWWTGVREGGGLRRDLGAGRAACAHLTLAGTLAMQLSSPALVLGAVAAPLGGGVSRLPAARVCAGALAASFLARLLAGLAWSAPGAGRGAGLGPAPAVWLLEGIAAWRALYRAARHPPQWETTPHPIDDGEGGTRVGQAPGSAAIR